MLARLAIFVLLGAIIVFPIMFIDADDGLEMRLFVQVMIPCTIYTIVAFGFCDQLFFKLKLYDIDLHNMATESATVDDPFESYRRGKVNLTESARDNDGENGVNPSLLGSADS